MDSIRCLVSRGFKHFDPACRRSVFVGPGQEIDLVQEEFDRLHKAGAVCLREEMEQAQANDDEQRMGLLREHFRREPTPVEIDNFSRVPTDRLADLLTAQRVSQAEWEAAKEQRLREKIAREEAAATAEAERHQRAADRARKRSGKGSAL